MHFNVSKLSFRLKDLLKIFLSFVFLLIPADKVRLIEYISKTNLLRNIWTRLDSGSKEPWTFCPSLLSHLCDSRENLVIHSNWNAKHACDCSKWSSKYFWEIFLRILDPKIPVFYQAKPVQETLFVVCSKVLCLINWCNI